MARKTGNVIYSVWDVFWIRVSFLFSSVRSSLSLRLQGCKPGSNFRTSGRCHFKARHRDSIRIGSNAVLLANWRSNRVGLSGPVLLTTLGDGIIEIGDDFGASAVVISSRSKVTIGNHVMVGGNVRIYDHDFHSMDAALRKTIDDFDHCITKPVVLGDDVFVGANALILKGVTLGDRVIVGAGSVVTKSYPSDVVVAGNPARIIAKGVTKKPE
jgi:acetyltransferase-like isoleucine patch superfamily enzyme